MWKRVCCFALLLASALSGAEFKAGVARVRITPEGPIWMSGYASRKKPSEGVIHDLWAKALALEDRRGNRVVIVTTDLIGLPRSLAEAVAAEVQKRYRLERARLLLNASHTHTGPMVRGNLTLMFDLSDDEQRKIERYGQRLAEDLVTVIGAALGRLVPAQLAFGQGTVGFAVNRREPTEKGIRLGVNPKGPVDHSVPVLRVTDASGKLVAVLFGYACHTTTLTGEFYQISGDYAGFAQIELEKTYPEAAAMFLMLCGGDQNPHPRSTLELAEQHGRTLAQEVERVLSNRLRPLRGPLRAAFRIVEPQFAPHTRETFEQRLNDPHPVRARHARAMLALYDERRPIRRIPYPVQAIRFGDTLTLVALGGEVVVDYALRIKREYPGEEIVVAGYSNDVMCYIPSLRVLKEGGYEAVDSMLYYGQPGPFSEDVEEIVFSGIYDVLKRVGRRPVRP
ncbi:MAG: neutral/alkaline non-lysosomal ceramidase N-terminal domain-containing protein [Bryobacterales bacterium]|nr:neutral/alkaline non-lysosomal ceramidase N-terminal domain-containing protein [Bryobacteraceae bacterium]MDW8352895.1 neutral/alkaline non-lysosomal ceramidase N-terminal domain-containing protein [Bryobacterales bacterium]